MSDATVKLPGVGPVKKQYAYIGGGVVLLLVIYTVRKRQAAAAAAAADTSSTTAASTAAVDPATGYPSGSPEDLAALAQQNTGSYLSSGGGGSSGTVTDNTSSAPANSYASNGAWAQAAETYMTSNLGADATTVAAALGKYISGQEVTDAQQSVIEQAIAFSGYPPISAANGYPPSIRQMPAAPTIPPPQVPTGLKQTEATKTSFTMVWNLEPSAAYYWIYVNSERSTEKLYGNRWIVNSGHTPQQIHPNSTYSVQVTGVNSAGVESAKSAVVTAHTSK